jgi:hypothetical protein
MEKQDWKPFRNVLDKKGRKKFDEINQSALISQKLIDTMTLSRMG